MRGSNDVGHVFGSQCRSGQTAAEFVDAFSVGERTALFHHTFERFAVVGFNAHADFAIIQQQDIATLNIFDQVGKVQTDAAGIARNIGLFVKSEGAAVGQKHAFFFEFGYTDFGSLQIGQYADMHAFFFSDFAHDVDAVDVLLRGAV